jgi:hypothetical protein
MWVKNGDEKRVPKGVQDGGDYVTTKHKYTLMQLGFEESKRTKTFYIEGIRPSESGASATHVSLEYQP